ncbi:MAG: AAA family ATPase [Bacteroidetes bacterium 4572_112]|nr:MAG: AAA family ATPase [Bacteroidetes bacterium 4572_112]
MENISQSLAGRIALLKLLPLSQRELKKAKLFPQNSKEIMFNGNYPAVYSRKIPADIFYSNYLSTYIERDVRTLKNIGNLNLFTLFVQLCAGRIGQPLNYSSLASDTGISVNTAKEWLSVLESSYIIFLLRPHHKNYNKRLIKMPKLYFYDTGLVSNLLKIELAEQIQNHYLLGNIFENYVVSELLKNRYNQGKKSNLFYWKDNKGKEVDIIIDSFDNIIAIEIKASQTYNLNAFDNIKFYRKISSNNIESHVISRVDNNKLLSNESFVSWKNIDF